MASKIRVGMVGITPNRGFSSIAHMPALQALPDFEISRASAPPARRPLTPQRSTTAFRWPSPTR